MLMLRQSLIEAELKTAAARYLPATNTNAAIPVETQRER
jgi:hypothetical protein